MAKELPLAALLGAGATYGGDLRFEGRVRIDGHFTGSIHTTDVLEVGSAGRVEGTLDVATLLVAGTVSGKVRVGRTLLVEGTGTLLGEVVAANLEVEPGARIDAHLRIGPLEAKGPPTPARGGGAGVRRPARTLDGSASDRGEVVGRGPARAEADGLGAGRPDEAARRRVREGEST